MELIDTLKVLSKTSSEEVDALGCVLFSAVGAVLCNLRPEEFNMICKTNSYHLLVEPIIYSLRRSCLLEQDIDGDTIASCNRHRHLEHQGVRKFVISAFASQNLERGLA